MKEITITYTAEITKILKSTDFFIGKLENIDAEQFANADMKVAKRILELDDVKVKNVKKFEREVKENETE